MKDHNLFSVIPYKDHLIQLENPVRAFAYYKKYAIDLLSGKKIDYDFSNWIVEIQRKNILEHENTPRVMHLFYELSFLIEKENQFLSEDTLLVIDCEYKNYKKIANQFFKKIQLKRQSSPPFKEYKKAFSDGYRELLEGNCYQFNLTYPFIYSFNEDYSAHDFIFSLWSKKKTRGAFGSASYIPYFQKLFLSNSPECLFQLRGNKLSTMPIKGTLPIDSLKNWKLEWKKLANDKKSQAELYMISDLLRNDLSRIDKPQARVVKKKSPKLVPGLLHQYSQIEVELSSSVNLWQILEKIFPGGSITGAPKRRAIRLLYRLEKRKRGFYCGSTLILFKNMKSASINIRSAEIDFHKLSRTLLYQSGGGITLLSNAKDEFREMTYKRDSFIDTLTL